MSNYILKIPSSQDYLVKADKFLEDILKQHGLDDDTIADLAISTTELINNAILHGNKNDIEKEVGIEISFADDHLTITVTDQGEGFVPEEIPDPIDNNNLLKETGRGIFIVRSLVDDLQFKLSSNGGTHMIITKNLAS